MENLSWTSSLITMITWPNLISAWSKVYFDQIGNQNICIGFTIYLILSKIYDFAPSLSQYNNQIYNVSYWYLGWFLVLKEHRNSSTSSIVLKLLLLALMFLIWYSWNVSTHFQPSVQSQLGATSCIIQLNSLILPRLCQGFQISTWENSPVGYMMQPL